MSTEGMDAMSMVAAHFGMNDPYEQRKSQGHRNRLKYRAPPP